MKSSVKGIQLILKQTEMLTAPAAWPAQCLLTGVLDDIAMSFFHYRVLSILSMWASPSFSVSFSLFHFFSFLHLLC